MSAQAVAHDKALVSTVPGSSGDRSIESAKPRFKPDLVLSRVPLYLQPRAQRVLGRDGEHRDGFSHIRRPGRRTTGNTRIPTRTVHTQAPRSVFAATRGDVRPCNQDCLSRGGEPPWRALAEVRSRIQGPPAAKDTCPSHQYCVELPPSLAELLFARSRSDKKQINKFQELVFSPTQAKCPGLPRTHHRKSVVRQPRRSKDPCLDNGSTMVCLD